MKKRAQYKRPLAWLLALCLLAGLLPGLGAARAAVSPRAAGFATVGNGPGDYKTLQEAYDSLNGSGGAINVKIDVFLEEPLSFKQTNNISISSSTPGGINIKIKPGYESKFTTGPGVDGVSHNSLIYVEGGVVTLGNGISIDPNKKCRSIAATNNAHLTLDGCEIRNGNLTTSQLGAGVYVSNGAVVDIKGGTKFTNNKGDINSSTGGGALYVGKDSTATLGDVTFSGNEANSGGAIYVYKGNVYCTAETKFENNRADQRGGAIHDHGVVVLDGTTITGHASGQYGGGVYVSASADDIGRLVLHNASITGNSARNSGGGVFIADNAEAYIGGTTTVTGNDLSDLNGNPMVDADGKTLVSNLYASTSTSKIIAYTAPGCADKGLGVSTANPYTKKPLVYSLTGGHALAGKTVGSVTLPASYSMSASADGADYKKFAYDSEVWSLEKTKDNPDDLWLNYSSAVSGGGNQIIFDYNLPGTKPLVYSNLTVGEQKALPGLSSSPVGSVTFKPLGWFTEPTGGAAAPDPATAANGTTVYYAQWKIETKGDTGGTPGKGDLYLVYFNLNYEGGGLTTSYITAGTFNFTVEYQWTNPETGKKETRYDDVTVKIPFTFPADPYREGYIFKGWGTSATATTPVDKGSWAPASAVSNLFAVWTPQTYTLTWNANGGTGGTTTTQARDSIVAAPAAAPTRTGYKFTGWYLDKACTLPLVSGTVVKAGATYFAGWEANEYTITWDVNYTGGSVTTVKQKYDDKLLIMPEPVRTGYAFGGWYTEPSGGGTRADAFGKVKGDEAFYANWVQGAIDYTVTVEWADQSDNDAVRPEEITVELTRNDLPTGQTYTLTADDADDTGNKWSHTFEHLPETDSTSREYTYSVAITSPVSSEYVYGIENKSATLGYILMTHTLITRDVNAFVSWDDNGDRDGIRPASVRLQLVANGTPVADGEATATLTGTGDAWAYTFSNVQKYYTTEDGTTGREIAYTIEAGASVPGELDGYTIGYSDYTAILRHEPETVSQTITVVWADSNDQDGKRPASMFVQLYADNVPVPEKYVLLSAANAWEYTWDGLHRYADGGREIAYSAHVTSTLVDYTAATTGMTIEMTYVPSSTTISAFVSWQDGGDVDGLRPETVALELYADGIATGDRQIASATNGWTTAWSNYPIYKDGSRIEYTFAVVDVPEGYEASYFGTYDTSGLSVVLSHGRILADQTVTITWEDQGDVALARPSRVRVMLYADGDPIPERTAILAGEDWSHTFAGMPAYRDGGTGIRYSAYVISDVGRYVPHTDGLNITMGYTVETVDVPLSVKWDDREDADGKRPGFVVATLTIDGQPTKYQSMATVENGWEVCFEGMKAYSAENPGVKIGYGVQVAAPEGYTAIYAGTYCVLTYSPTTTSATPIIHWNDNNDQYAQRPDKLALALLADGTATGRTAQAYAADNWTVPAFEGLPRYNGQREIIYSVQASGAIGNYDVAAVGMDVYLTHKAISEGGYTTDYTATVIWADNDNAMDARPAVAVLTLYANGAAYRSYTLTREEITGPYIWKHTFTGLPTHQGGKPVLYTASMSEIPHYAQAVTDGNLTLTQTVDVEITATWADKGDKDGKRPERLPVVLVANGLNTDISTYLTGTGDAWTATLTAPVWSAGKTIAYTYCIPAPDAPELVEQGYSINYNGYKLGEGSGMGDTLLFEVTLSRSTSDGGSSGGGGSHGGGGSGGSSGSSQGGTSGTGGGTQGGTTGGDTGTAGQRGWEVKAYVTGYKDGAFRPGNAIARCEVAAILARVSEGYDPGTAYPCGFLDVPEGAWYRNYLGFCVAEGYITGYDDGTFHPMDNISRGEFAAMAARFLALDNSGTAEYEDVEAGYWAEGYIAQLTRRGVVSGNGKGLYMPRSPISRAEAVKIVNGILDRQPDKDTLSGLEEAGASFSDLPPGTWYYYEVLEAANDHTHEGGKKDG